MLVHGPDPVNVHHRVGHHENRRPVEDLVERRDLDGVPGDNAHGVVDLGELVESEHGKKGESGHFIGQSPVEFIFLVNQPVFAVSYHRQPVSVGSGLGGQFEEFPLFRRFPQFVQVDCFLVELLLGAG